MINKEWSYKNRSILAASTAFFVSICIAAAGGTAARQKQVPKTTKANMEEAATNMAETVEGEIQAEVETILSESSDGQEPMLSDSQRELLNQIEQAVSEGDLEEAARLMIKHEKRLWVIYYDILGSELYLYHDGELDKDLDGQGMVIRKPTSVFVGEFQDGCPQGQGTALQVVELDYPRYDYSTGMWSDGKMNGEGSIGYCYYDGAGDENLATWKEGTFVDDCMEGEMTYSTTNSEEITSNWTMNAEAGKLVTDDRWTYDENRETYQLLANEDSSRAYVIGKQAMEDTVFQNMIPWN